ncbi:MAG: helix-turn-helix domain-containing protein [Geminicoccaceae bacterium]
MNAEPLKRYHSPLRQAQAEETRQRVLRAVADLLQRDPDDALAYPHLAAAAGVQERTVYRHFPTKDALLDAFWIWINERAGFGAFPTTEGDLIEQPRSVFAGFDAIEGIVRASLTSAAGREMRMRRVGERRAAFERSLGEVAVGLPAEDARRLTAAVHVLYSAPAWQVMRDVAGLTGAEAGEAASWAIRTLLAAARREAGQPDTSKQREKS